MEFRLFAPHTERVDLIGSWDEGAATAMHRGDDGIWRTDVDLADGRYTYRFRFPSLSPFMAGETAEISDPKAQLIDDWLGEASVIQVVDGEDVTTAPGFVWEHDDKPLPPNNELVIYELHVGEFAYGDEGQGSFLAVIDRLDYLRDLGINAVELMPVMSFAGSESWGYNIRYPFSLESSYGTPEDFKRLVDECHARGMRVILDVVLNHSDSEAPLTRIDFDYWYREREGVPSFGPPFDYERYDETLDVMPARAFALETIQYWVQTYHIDGYRLDATAPIDNFDIVRAVRDRAYEVAGGKPIYIVAEQLPEDPAIAGAEGPADGAWHQSFERTVVGWLCGEDGIDAGQVAGVLDPSTLGYVRPELVVNYIESHDEHTLMQEMAARGITGDAAFRRHKLAASLMFTAVGIPMLYQGQEFGGYRERDMEIRPLQWDLLDGDFGLHLKEHYAFLARLRNERPALRSAEIETLHVGDGELVFRRGSGDDEVVVAVNLHDEDRHLSVPFPDGTWWQTTGDTPFDVSGGTMASRFAASEARIFVRRTE
ncbi:MAG TPA: alpha-amylase family glycosyl hydrolase [Thermomicrobiales bacterium]|jgi:1,4-alpha-glucan branching enzyme|nr:alpha-amylase family glycosyl hydrolase [Thermomicrobiales bacterium]